MISTQLPPSQPVFVVPSPKFVGTLLIPKKEVRLDGKINRMHNLDDNNYDNNNNGNNNNDDGGGERASAVNRCCHLRPQQRQMKGVTMLTMPTATQDDAFHQGRENNNQQTTGARVMALTGDDDERGIDGGGHGNDSKMQRRLTWKERDMGMTMVEG